MTDIAILVGSTRPGRRAASVADWVFTLASQRDDARFQLIDLADHTLPLLDEPLPPLMGTDYSHAHTRSWATIIASFDAYVFVTPEYNHSIPGALKNAIDYLFHEWSNKAVGFVSYGATGGVLAAEHLRLVSGELMMADVRTQVALTLGDDFQDYQEFRPRPHQAEKLTMMLDELVAWARALAPLRT